MAGPSGLAAAARKLPVPFISKHNQGGKGLGVRMFASHAEYDAYLAGPDYEPPVDGITLLQEYLVAAQPQITRVEIVGGEFVYAITADTARGGFQLCPADACAVGPGGPGGLAERARGAEPVRAARGLQPPRDRPVPGVCRRCTASASPALSSSRPPTGGSSPTTSTPRPTTTPRSRPWRPRSALAAVASYLGGLLAAPARAAAAGT